MFRNILPREEQILHDATSVWNLKQNKAKPTHRCREQISGCWQQRVGGEKMAEELKGTKSQL